MKNKMKILSLIMMAVLTLGSCKKGLFETCVEGKVLNKKTGGTVANQKVYLLRQTAGNGFGGLGFEDVSSTTTSLGGYYKFVFKANGEKYFVQGTDDSNNDPRFFAGQPTGSIKNGKTSNVDVELEPKAKLNISIKNKLPLDSNDNFVYQLYENNIRSWSDLIKGSNVDYYIVINLLNGVEGNNRIEYTYTRNGITINKDTSFFVKSFETVNITINY
jgi:hypothetical protein